MRKVSLKQQVKKHELQQIKAGLPKVCCICGQPGNELMHLLPRSTYPEYYTKSENLAIGCKSCHYRYDNDLSFRQQQYELIERVQSFDELAANRYFDL